MKSLAGLIARLDRATKPDRRLDSEIVAALLGPPDCILDPIKSVDGWDIQTADGRYWREAEDVPGVTAFMDAACELVAEVAPEAGAGIIARGLCTLTSLPADMSVQDMAGRAARVMMVELIRSVALGEYETLLASSRAA